MSPRMISVRSRPARKGVPRGRGRGVHGRNDQQAYRRLGLGQKTAQQLSGDKARIARDENGPRHASPPLTRRCDTWIVPRDCAVRAVLLCGRRRQVLIEPVGDDHHVGRQVGPAVRLPFAHDDFGGDARPLSFSTMISAC